MHRFAPIATLAIVGTCIAAPSALAYRDVAITVKNQTAATLMVCGWNGQDPVERGEGVPRCGSGPFDIAPNGSRRIEGSYHSSPGVWDTVVQVRLRQSPTQTWQTAPPVVCGAGKNPATGKPSFAVSARWGFSPIYARRQGKIWTSPPAAYKRCNRSWWSDSMAEGDSHNFSSPAYASGTVRRNDDSSDCKEFVLTVTGTGS